MFAEFLTVVVLLVPISGSQQHEVQCVIASRPEGSSESHVFKQDLDGAWRALEQSHYHSYVDYCAQRLGVKSPTHTVGFWPK